uniref:Uncharacterized protein n=1 Tax=Anguilla anguilla TaxID=7936 RepID=A0A0E9T7J7_ANGAN
MVRIVELNGLFSSLCYVCLFGCVSVFACVSAHVCV